MNTYKKFTGKEADYAKYRPAYPTAFLDYLSQDIGLSGQVVADIGCGTGIFTRLLAHFTQMVYGIEPNCQMRESCEKACAAFANIIIQDGTAEYTGLAEDSVDSVTAAQAFHWFDVLKFKKECQRILKADGQVILLWNSLDKDHPVIDGISQLCKQLGLCYTGFNSGMLEGDCLRQFFANGQYLCRAFDNPVILTEDQFVGRYLSSSYAPMPEEAGHADYVSGLIDLFECHQTDGLINLPYQTICFIGTVG